MMFFKRHLPDKKGRLPLDLVESEQWRHRHPEAGSSWPSWPKVSPIFSRAGGAAVFTCLVDHY